MEIKKLRDTYGQQHARDSQAIPYQRIAAFLQEVEALATEKRENDASKKQRRGWIPSSLLILLTFRWGVNTGLERVAYKIGLSRR